MMDFLREIYYVAWGDLKFLRHNVINIMIMSLVSPLLYLFTFGYGLAGSMVESDLPYIAFIIPGIVALSSLNASFSSTATRLNVQRLYYRSFDEMMICPLRNSSIILGKSTLGVVRGMLSCSFIFIMGLFLAPQLMLTPLFILCLILSCYTFSLLGVTAALLAKSHQNMATFSALVILPMTFLCGTFFALENLPGTAQAILYCFPLTHSSTILRAAALGWEFPWISLIALSGFFIVFFLIDIHLIKTRKI